MDNGGLIIEPAELIEWLVDLVVRFANASNPEELEGLRGEAATVINDYASEYTDGGL